jgi:hypothetical protein
VGKGKTKEEVENKAEKILQSVDPSLHSFL